MADSNYYETLQVNPQATQAEIKRSHRRLAKLYHPDSQQETANHDRIVQLNAAYEILGDSQRRQSYDQQQNFASAHTHNWQQRAKAAANYNHKQPKTARDTDAQIQQWIYQVYQPVSRLISLILNPFKQQIDELAADPFDDELMADFQEYLQNCRHFLEQAQLYFRSMPNPAQVAGAAASLYYCLNQVGDGINELEFFTLNYDESYLHAGHEMFRIASGLRREAQAALKNIA